HYSLGSPAEIGPVLSVRPLVELVILALRPRAAAPSGSRATRPGGRWTHRAAQRAPGRRELSSAGRRRLRLFTPQPWPTAFARAVRAVSQGREPIQHPRPIVVPESAGGCS